MKTKKLWVATVQIAVVADNEGLATDRIAQMLLSNTGVTSDIPDWQFLALGGQQLSPSRLCDYDEDHEFKEGELFERFK